MKKTLLSLTAILFTMSLMANNIQLSAVSISGQNTTSDFSLINFGVSWENSWRTITNETNYDGAWIFAKFRKKSSNTWQHATINGTGSTVPAGSVIQTSLDGKGVWVYKSLPTSDFTGNVDYSGASIRWNYGVDGVLDTDSVEIRVFAVEMVYIPAGAFRLGTGGSEINHFFEGGGNNPYNVASNASITVANTSPNLYYSSSNFQGGDLGSPVPLAFPKGFNAFWVMKYESSQQQYADFLNNIDLIRANNRYAGTFTGTHPNLVAPFPERAMANTSILDQLAFADWAGMRPYTEFEYEKICRGANQLPTPNEYPWGTTFVQSTTVTINTGFDNETANDGNANYNNSLNRPARNGIYATGTSIRQSSGGSFYGVMEMAGNTYETVIGIGSAEGRGFQSVHGDGNIDAAGNANALTWPTSNLAFSLRGGGYSDAPAQLRLSDRTTGAYANGSSIRIVAMGLRTARTAE